MPRKAIFGAAGIAAPDEDNLLLIHSNDTDGSAVFIDSGPDARTDTVNGNTHHETDQAKFGTTSIHFDGTGDYLTYPDSDDWAFSGDFTIDFWMYTSDTATRKSIIRKGLDGVWSVIEWGIFMNDSVNKVTFQFSNNGSSGINLASTTSINDSTWHHIAVVRNGNRFDLYIDGTSEANKTNAYTARNDSTVLAIGAESDGSDEYTGYLDEIRISNIARWTTNFTPPTSAY
jgi:hypothetical protein